MERPINRLQPAAPVGAYQTYRIDTRSDRLVKTACENVGCLPWRYGWDSKIDESTPLGQAQARYIRQESGRTFTEQRTAEGLTVFRFESGQRCFSEHQTHPEIYAVTAGDWRRHLGTLRKHANAHDWVEDFGEHQLRLVDQQQKG